jgi:epsilon-lactone hydrolase
MADRGIDVVRAHLAKLPPSDSLTTAERRAQYERAEKVFPTPSDVKVERVNAPVAPAEWLRPPSAEPGRVVLYLHGGGYVIGSPRSHRHLAAAIAGAAGASALLLDYRLAPEHPFPAAVEDATAAYRWLLDQAIAPERIVIAGDSAGGGLTVATLLALREARVPLPAGGVCISPWVDLTCSAASYATKADADPIVRRAGVEEMAQAYLGTTSPRTPLASPVFADLRGLPPLLIHVGRDEVLLDDAVQLAERAKAAGVDATLDIYERMIHVWHWFLPMLDEAQTAVEAIGRFVRARGLTAAPHA